MRIAVRFSRFRPAQIERYRYPLAPELSRSKAPIAKVR
jgi:hypothetical protein